MQELKAEKPIESPAGTSVVSRLMERLAADGFTTGQAPDDWTEFGEIIFHRDEQISFAAGETIVIFTRVPEMNERVLRQTSESVVNTYKAKSLMQKALSVLQSTTVYHCLVVEGDQPCSDTLDDYIVRSGGATFIPVVMVPEINQVLYPQPEERHGAVGPRIEFLQFLLGERLESVNMHRLTIQALYVSLGVVVVLLLVVAFSFVR